MVPSALAKELAKMERLKPEGLFHRVVMSNQIRSSLQEACKNIERALQDLLVSSSSSDSQDDPPDWPTKVRLGLLQLKMIGDVASVSQLMPMLCFA